ncbi:hypothetical protein QBC47DRAFT_160531 [Echria macrotheca]|uniref:Uncharacterized protein n=1 Tax=Echria macrotheca TaxID=438768 RepID=A0AAJ0BFY7_9PEZI|nr:hypothetical protein QBC47DRAFT_160531 [Echria macrotheca]
MGGQAFGTGPDAPYTPRMPTPVYQQVRDNCHGALREHFLYVATPIPGPAKADHGDIDILVAIERRTIFPRDSGEAAGRETSQLMKVIMDALKADHAIVTGNSANLAIPWPEEMVDEEGDTQMSDRDPNVPKKQHIQVDVRICADLDQLCWVLFKHGHGDMWNILGSTIRPLGLTVDEDAMYLRIPEIEEFDRKRAKIMLSNDPVEILHFLGLRIEGYWDQEFGSVQAMFDYVTTCRLFWVRQGKKGNVGVVGGEEGCKNLKSNDRRRMTGRSVYRKWVTEFIPQLQAEGKFAPADPTKSMADMRTAVRDEAFTFFHVEQEYRRRLREWQIERNMLQVKGLVKAHVPPLEPQLRGCTMSALRKILLEDDGSFKIARPAALKASDGIYDLEAVKSFIVENWKQVSRVAWFRYYGEWPQDQQPSLKRKADEAL